MALAKIAVNLIQYTYRGKIVQNYAQTVLRSIKALGHEVTAIGLGTEHPNSFDLVGYDLFLDLDCGRDVATGELCFRYTDSKSTIPSVIWFIDSHGNPTLHRRIAKNYDHVFFAVWDKRDLFINHKSAHWCPNATDSQWFNPSYKVDQPYYDFGFFGSRMGLERADALMDICDLKKFNYDVRSIGKVNTRRWPATAQAMGNCKTLFNHQQKHDGPNLRVLESMAMGIPLICDEDPRSGLGKLFKPYEHYIPYDSYTYKGLEEAINFVKNNEVKTATVAASALVEIQSKHLIANRVSQMLEIFNGSR